MNSEALEALYRGVNLSMGISDAEGLKLLERMRAPLSVDADRALLERVDAERERGKALNLPKRHGNNLTW